MKNFFDRIKAAIIPKDKFVFTTNNLGRNTANGMRIQDAGVGSDSAQLNSFVSIDNLTQSWGATNTNSTGVSIGSITGNIEAIKSTKKEDERKTVEPIEVFDEIKRETPSISFEDLDTKIGVVKERIAVLKEHLDESHLRDEHKALFFLENRKKYLKTQKKTPLDWALTTREAVDDLCKRYKLQVVALKQYYTLVPKEGIAEMKRFTAAYKAITGDEPIYELVIKESTVAPQQKKKDRDPILLANSPLGNHLFIVGVWDDEVEVVDEIIYGWK